MEIDANGNIVQREGSVGRLRMECKLTILYAVPKDASLRKFHLLFAGDKTALCHVRGIERETYSCSAHDADSHLRLFAGEVMARRKASRCVCFEF